MSEFEYAGQTRAEWERKVLDRGYVLREKKAWRIWPALLIGGAAAFFFARAAFAQAAAPAQAGLGSWQEQLLALAGAALMAGLTAVLAKVNAYFAAHAKSAAAQYGANVFSRLGQSALTAAQAVEQLAQKDLAAGFSQAKAAQLKTDAVAYLKSYLGPEGLAELAKIVGADQVAQVLGTHVEAAVLQLNQSQGSTAASAASAASAGAAGAAGAAK